nr:reverse transcriptase domain-containing protein [Tanacetum cinerariifolium]
EKLHQEKAQQEKLKAVKARLNFKEASWYSESETPSRRRNLKERLGPRYAQTRSESLKQRLDRSKSPREKDPERRTVFKGLEKGVFHRLGDKEKNVSAHSRGSERKSYYSSRSDTESCYPSSRSKETEITFEKHRHKREYSRRTEEVSESEGNAGGHWKSKTKKQKSSIEDDLSQPWVCEELYPFTPRIRYFDFPKARMSSHIKTYDESEDPKDHWKIFQAAAKTERWAMPTWHHIFNSTLTENARVWFIDLTKESINSYDDLRKTFLENYLQQKKCIKYLVEIHNIKQSDEESTKEFIRRYKLECKDVKGALECMKISVFMQEITNPELIKRLHDKIPKSMDQMMSVTTTFLRGEVAASNRERKKSFPSSKQEAGQKQNFKRGNFQNEQRTEQKQDRFPLLANFEALTFDQGIKVKPWKRPGKDSKKGGNLRERQIAGNINGEEDRTKGPMIIKAEMGGHCVHHIYVDEGSSLEILYKHCFSKFLPKIKNQLIPTNTPLVRFSGEIIWPLGQISLLVMIGDEKHSTSAWMNFMVVRSPSLYNGIIGRPRNQEYRGLSLTKSRKKNPAGNPSRISGTNHSNRLYPNRGRTKRAVRIVKTSP